MTKKPEEFTQAYRAEEIDEEEDDDDDEGGLDGWDDWNADDEEDGGSDSGFLCLFCDSKYSACDSLFDHCHSVHHFDFHSIRRALGLDFYGSFKLINYIRAQVSENICWSCGFSCQSNQALQNHLHKTVNFENSRLWDDDKYLKPFMENDSLLYSFGDDEEGEDDLSTLVGKDELLSYLKNTGAISVDKETSEEKFTSNANMPEENGGVNAESASFSHLNGASSSGMVKENGTDSNEDIGSCERKAGDYRKASLLNLSQKDVKNVNESYFGSYSSFGIHREMISDKVRMEAYRKAIIENPSLLNNAVVMDVGCGTGILSLFAAKAGASRVIAIEASEKMAAVATQIAKENGLLHSKSQSESNRQVNPVIEVVQGMVEEVDKSIQIQPHSVDVLLSEWMGYCLLYESMLSSVLFARDRWLKPGGAILPDTATMFVAGFGKGGTSLPFWDNVYGFDMSCIGKELVKDAAQIPIVDIVNDHDIVTNAATLQTFDLATMKHHDVDFTSNVALEPSILCSQASNSSDSNLKPTWCFGVVLWFETGFTSRFCKEMPSVLSTSPYAPETHWSQTILTFKEPIALSSRSESNGLAAVGTEACPATKINLRISLVRAVQHRSIDISLETSGIGSDGRKCSLPTQIFNLR